MCCSEIRGLGLITDKKIRSYSKPREPDPSQRPVHLSAPGTELGVSCSNTSHRGRPPGLLFSRYSSCLLCSDSALGNLELLRPTWTLTLHLPPPTGQCGCRFISFCFGFVGKPGRWVVTVIWMRRKESETWFKIAVQLSKWCLEKRWDSGSVCWMNQWPKKQRDQFDLLT